MAFSDPAFVEIYEQIDGERTIDLEFYRSIARESGGPVLEAGCGSGRVLLRILQDGIHIDGFDPSEAMLDLLQKRATDQRLKADVWVGDFTSIEKEYTSIISPFNSVMHLLTQEEQIEAFTNLYRHLQPEGVFAFDVVNPHTLDIYDDSREFEASMIDARTGVEYQIWRQFEHDPITQIGAYNREFISGDKTLHSTLHFRWLYPSEITLLLKLAGFSSWEVFGGFNGEPLEPDSTSQVWIARK